MTEAIRQLTNLRPTIQQAGDPIMDRVERFAQHVETNFTATAGGLIKSAEQLELRAQKLREHAERLINNKGLADDLRKWIDFERKCSTEVQSLAFVTMPNRTE